jgi:hypothetical protein
MMKRNAKRIMCGLLFMASSLLPSAGRLPFNSIASSNEAAVLQATERFEKYRSWLQVNKKPMVMESSASLLCAPPTIGRQRTDSPHKDKFIVVFVNQSGSQAMMEQLQPKFPQGSVIVKEKLSSAESASPELLTAMVKREKGFNPAGNDWEFFVLSGDAKTLQAQGRLDSCLACHTAKRGNDFVFRNYLPGDVKVRLKD